VKPPLGIDEIRRLLPHRYPILLVDRVLEISDTDVVAEKLVSANEPFFQGHFPDRPIFPGVLIIEALAQAAGLGFRWSDPASVERGVALVGVNKARFRKPVVPGDTLELYTHVRRRRGDLIVFEGVARVMGETVAEAEIMAALVDWDGKK
jgi:beta-hydroxyacyl-ACP dehydratase FabZ